MRRDGGRHLAIAGWVSALIMLGLALALPALAGYPEGSTRACGPECTSQVLAFGTVGAVILWHRPKQPVGWILLTAGTSQACTFLLGQYAQLSVPAPRGAAWFALAAEVPAFIGVTCWALLLLFFPDGRLPSRRWRPVVLLLGVVIVATLADVLTLPGKLTYAPHLANPLGGLGGALFHSLLNDVTRWGGTAVIPVAIASLIIRFLHSGGRERQQIKILIYALACALALAGLQSYVPAHLPYVLKNAFWVFGISGFAWAVGIAVLRYQLYDIDRLISRTISYALLTALLGGLYVAGTLLLGSILQPATDGSALAVAGATLAVAAAFRPARRRIQGFVDRRFHRTRYDLALIVDGFSSRLRDQLDLNDIDADLLSAVHATVGPAQASLWLRSRADWTDRTRVQPPTQDRSRLRNPYHA